LKRCPKTRYSHCYSMTKPKKRERTLKRSITLSLVLTLSVLLSLVSFPSTMNAQQPQRFKVATGFVTPGMGQTLRVTVAAGDVTGDDTITVRIRWMQYEAAGCSGLPPVCRHTVESQGVTEPMTLSRTDAISFDVPSGGTGVNIVVESNSRNAKVLGIVFDTSTQRIMSIMHPFGDF
jgi:hypothetical protein